jgi:cellulose synthase operon protein C
VRMQPGEVPQVTARLAGLLPRRETSLALVDHLCAALHHWSPPHHRSVGLALLPLLEADRLAAHLAIRVLAKLSDDVGFADGLERLSARAHLHHDAVAAALAAVGGFAFVDRLSLRLAGHKDARLRRVGLGALVNAARPENGWTDDRRALLLKFQSDADVEVAAPAAWVFPPPV